MPTMFYQEFLLVVGQDVSMAYLRILNGNEDHSLQNNTLMTLILKCNDPKRVREFRPIIMCNVMYKLIASASLIG